MSGLTSIFVFIAVIMAIAGVYAIVMDLFLRDRANLNDRLQEEFRSKQRERAKNTPLFKDFADTAREAFGGPTFKENLRTFIDAAGLDWSINKLVGISIGMGCFMGGVPAAGFFLAGNLLTAVGGLLVGFCVGCGLPFMYVRIKQRQRIDAIRAQLPDTFDMMARVIRAGQTLDQSMQAVADEFAPPIALEFALCQEMVNLGIPDGLALQDLARRCNIMELKIFVMGIMIQKEVGGNLAELLDNLSHVVRERFRINGVIASLTAEGRMQAAVLLAIPPGMLVIMLVLNRDYAGDLIVNPILLILLAVSESIGWLWIRQIVNFDF
ncbi:MAG: type II secretion system F family protein [Planctomycetales bacterium]